MLHPSPILVLVSVTFWPWIHSLYMSMALLILILLKYSSGIDGINAKFFKNTQMYSTIIMPKFLRSHWSRA